MIIVADTSPISYLILIEQVEILPRLYGRILIPPQVLGELQSDDGPAPVRSWAQNPQAWLEIKAPSAVDMTLAVDEGERAAICLAKELNAHQLLMDDRAAREVAARMGISTAGTLAVLFAAGVADLLDFEKTMQRLRQTNFRVSKELLDQFHEKYRRRKNESG